MRVAIYARYSSEHQNERSIDDQVRLCREHAGQLLGAEIIGVYADYALSGSSLKSRPEAARLLTDAGARIYDAVLTEALDRLSRDQEDIARIFKRLNFAGVRLLTVAEGEIGELHIGFKGTMNALFLRDLKAKIKRGQRGRAGDGLTPGGLSYGYEVVREFDAKGELLRGRRRVIEAEAVVIRRIFDEFAAGRSARSIAAGLNRDGIRSPRGGAWGTNTINGSRSRSSGILYNEAYIGRVVYNRTTFSKNPDTGRRVSRPLPTADRVVTPVETLRIVSDEIWQAVQARKARYANMPLHKRRRPRHPFSGLVRCGICGGSFRSRTATSSPARRTGRRVPAPTTEPFGSASSSDA
jgi:DNA invertase Pin-like site-specific DNA recombinase